MYKKNIFHYCCYVLIFSFVILLLTPFITCLMYIKSGEDVIGFGVMTGIIAVAGMFVNNIPWGSKPQAKIFNTYTKK